jgi:hypothetical protein
METSGKDNPFFLKIVSQDLEEELFAEITARQLGKTKLNQTHEIERVVVTVRVNVPLGAHEPLYEVAHAEGPVNKPGEVRAQIESERVGRLAETNGDSRGGATSAL